MRTYKFRVWDKLGEGICPVEELSSKEVAIGMFDEEYGHLEKRKIEDVEVMQFIGLKDKDEREIFEGDILKTNWQHDGSTNYDYELIGVVKWDDECYQFVIEKDKGDGTISYPLHSFEREELDEESIEVLGNVYENSELLQ